MRIGSAESILSEANVPRNDTACRIATHPSGARNDSYVRLLGSLSLFLSLTFPLLFPDPSPILPTLIFTSHYPLTLSLSPLGRGTG